MSPFAAGCAICGEDLEAFRRRRRSRLRSAMRTSVLPHWRVVAAERVALTSLLLLVALYAPIYGVVFGGLVVYDRNRQGHRFMRNVAAVCVLIAVLGLFTPFWPGGRFGPVGR